MNEKDTRRLLMLLQTLREEGAHEINLSDCPLPLSQCPLIRLLQLLKTLEARREDELDDERKRQN
jgi:hypothetical protein